MAVSAEVCTVTLTAPAVAAPMTKPDIVTTNAEAGMAAPPVVRMTELALVALHIPVNPATVLLPAETVGVDAAKNDWGNLSVIVPAIGSNVVKVKAKVTGTAAFAAMRSDEATVNEIAVTCPLIAPEGTGGENSVSEEVYTVIPTAPAVTGPI